LLQRSKGEEDLLHTTKEANWIGHIFRMNCLLKHVIKGKTEGTRRRGRRRKQLLDNLRKKGDTRRIAIYELS